MQYKAVWGKTLCKQELSYKGGKKRLYFEFSILQSCIFISETTILSVGLELEFEDEEISEQIHSLVPFSLPKIPPTTGASWGRAGQRRLLGAFCCF